MSHPSNRIAGQWLRWLRLSLVLLMLGVFSLAPSAQGSRRLALVVGNDAYRSVEPLVNARNDARLMSDLLRRAGFDVTLQTDLDRNRLWSAIDNLRTRINKGDEVVFYFAGHGVQIASNQLLLPVDITAQNDRQVERDGIALVDVQDALRDARFAMLIIDACRDNPFPKQGTRSVGGTRGLSPPEPATGQVIMMSAGRNQKALDKVPDGRSNNGLFTWELTQVLQQPGMEIRNALESVKDRVDEQARRANHEQRPSLVNDLRGSFFLFPGGASVAAASAPAAPAAAQRDPEEEAWGAAQRVNTARAYMAYLQGFPSGRFSAAARVALAGFDVAPASVSSTGRDLGVNATPAAAPATAASPPAVVAALTPQRPMSSLPTIQWRLASSFPKSIDRIFGGATELARSVSERTGGRFRIAVFAAGEITPSFGVVDAAKANTVEAAHTFPYYFFGKDVAWTMGSYLPFGVNSQASDQWLQSEAGRTAFGEFTRAQGLISLPLGAVSGDVSVGGTATPISTLNALWCRRPIRSVEDLRGLKVRVPGGLEAAMWTRLGAQVVALPGGEIYPALEKGVLDCAAWLTPYDDERLGLYKVAPYYHYFPAQAGARSSVQSVLLLNASAWQSLPPEYQRALSDAARDADTWVRTQYDSENLPALRRLVASGAKLTILPRDVSDAARSAALAEYEEQTRKSADFNRLYRAWQSARR